MRSGTRPRRLPYGSVCEGAHDAVSDEGGGARSTTASVPLACREQGRQPGVRARLGGAVHLHDPGGRGGQRKRGDDAADQVWIFTRRGVGYRIPRPEE